MFSENTSLVTTIQKRFIIMATMDLNLGVSLSLELDGWIFLRSESRGNAVYDSCKLHLSSTHTYLQLLQNRPRRICDVFVTPHE